jgi:hypothetical protein
VFASLEFMEAMFVVRNILVEILFISSSCNVLVIGKLCSFIPLSFPISR